jgi:hypothetical protein
MACYYAPNGQTSNLYEEAKSLYGEQKAKEIWYKVRTPEFLNNFGNWMDASKELSLYTKDSFEYNAVLASYAKLSPFVDNNFEPKIMYLQDANSMKPFKTNLDSFINDDNVNRLINESNIKLGKLTQEENNNVEEKLKTFFTQFGFQFKEGDSSTDLLQKIIYTNKEDSSAFIDNSVKVLSQLLLANSNIDFNKLQDLAEETLEFKDLLKNSSEYIKNTHQYLKQGNRLPMQEWISYIKEYDKLKNTVIEKYLKESLLDKNNSTGLHKLINDFLKFFKDLFSNAKNLKEVTDSLIQQVLNNQRETVINSQQLKNREKVTLAKALEETTHGKDIIKTFGEFGLILTGSVSAAEQGSVFRKVGKLLHDIDWVVPKGFTKDFNKKLKDTFTGSTLVREFDSESYYTQTYIVPPKGYTISNLTFFKPEVYGKNKFISSYDVLDKDGKVVSNYRRYYDVKESGKVIENREVYNEGLENVDKNLEAISVDFFQNKKELKFQPYTVNVEGIELQLSNWMSSFTEKLKYNRAKDLLDYALFIPNDVESKDQIKLGKLTESEFDGKMESFDYITKSVGPYDSLEGVSLNEFKSFMNNNISTLETNLNGINDLINEVENKIKNYKTDSELYNSSLNDLENLTYVKFDIKQAILPYQDVLDILRAIDIYSEEKK